MSIASTICRIAAPPIFRSMGIDIFGKRDWLVALETWPLDRRTEWRIAKLNALLDHCWSHVPFYRHYWSDHGLRHAPLHHLDELGGYPSITRDLVKANRDQIVPDNLGSIPHKSDSTGGTTGAPLKYFHDLELHALRYGFQILGWGLAGYKFGDPVYVASGGSLISGRQSLRNRARSWLERKEGLSCLHMDRELAVRCHRQMIAQGTAYLHGYPSTISLLSEFLQEAGLAVPTLKAVITTAEMLQPRFRSTIEQGLKVPVFDHYGCNDGGLLSYQCRLHSGYHYNDFESVLEVIEPDQLGSGRLAITNLWNRSMPFVRYENGDLLTMETAGQLCECGCGFPRIRHVIGRSADILRFSNGRALSGPGTTLIFKDLPVQAWQVAQVGSLKIAVRLITPKHLPAESEAYIREVLRQHLTSEVVVDINYVERLTTTVHGKLRPVFVENQTS